MTYVESWVDLLGVEERRILHSCVQVTIEDACHYCEYGADDRDMDEYQRLLKLLSDPAERTEASR